MIFFDNNNLENEMKLNKWKNRKQKTEKSHESWRFQNKKI
jgi:hypothetical protein